MDGGNGLIDDNIQQMRGSGPVYIVKPKYIFKHPFNKYDLANPSNRETQNEELTDYFNYGFNEDTMNIYGKLVKRFIEVLDHSKSHEYFKDPSELMRLNDQMPMDFGGFNRFYDPWLVDNEISTEEEFHDGESLMKYFVMMILTTSSQKKLEYPLIEFIKTMYPAPEEDDGRGNSLITILEQIGKNLEVKYQATMEKLTQKVQEPKVNPRGGDHKHDFRRNRERDNKPQEQPRSESHRNKHQEKQSRHHSSDDSESEDSQDSDRKKKGSHSEKSKKKKEKHRSRERSKDRDRHKKEKKDRDRDRDSDREKDRHKSKKVKKEKSHKRSYSREKDRKKKHH